MAVIGSGTYELRGIPEKQISVLQSVLLDAKENGANWELIYSAIFDTCAPQRPLLPTPDEMARQISAIERPSKQRLGQYADELKKGYEQAGPIREVNCGCEIGQGNEP